MSVIAGLGQVTAQKISRSITYYYTSRKPWGYTPPTTSQVDTILPSSPCLPISPSDPGFSSPAASSVDEPTFAQSLPSISPRPLLLLFPWLGARPGALTKYRDLYMVRGLDILMVESKVSHFLWPRWGLEYGAEILELLDDPRFKGRPLLVHAFSIGGYMFSQLLTHIVRSPQRYPGVVQRVVGHVYDSMVIGTLDHMATGLGKTLVPHAEFMVRYAALLYFKIFKSQTVDYYDRAIKVFFNTPINAPALFFFSENDKLCDPVAVDELVEFWRKRGITVESKKWKESVHAGHLRCHSEEYLLTLDKFMLCCVAALRAKL
ncbi:hypothetical protein UPYG_G00348550 [Umbra pygmaea]|uniref:Uncharacterized protein n=1 Tax=Umbra pygmaea TaxID=75934 RepID=A0ABD0W2G8_UMBPY